MLYAYVTMSWVLIEHVVFTLPMLNLTFQYCVYSTLCASADRCMWCLCKFVHREHDLWPALLLQKEPALVCQIHRHISQAHWSDRWWLFHQLLQNLLRNIATPYNDMEILWCCEQYYIHVLYFTSCCIFEHLHNTVEHSYNKPDIPGQTVCYKQEFVISEQFPIRYCSTWLRSLLCYTKKPFIEEFVTRVFHCKTV